MRRNSLFIYEPGNLSLCLISKDFFIDLFETRSYSAKQAVIGPTVSELSLPLRPPWRVPPHLRKLVLNFAGDKVVQRE